MDFQVFCQLQVELGQQFVWNDLVVSFLEVRDVDFLTSSVEGQLLFDEGVWAFFENFLDFGTVVQLDGHPQSNRVLLEFERDVVEDGEDFDEFVLIWGVAADSWKIHVDFGKVLSGDVLLDIF